MDDQFNSGHLRHARSRAPVNAPPAIIRSAELKSTAPSHALAPGRVQRYSTPAQGMPHEVIDPGLYPRSNPGATGGARRIHWS